MGEDLGGGSMKRTAIALSAILLVTGCAQFYVWNDDIYEVRPTGEVRKAEDGILRTIKADDAFIEKLRMGRSFDSYDDARDHIRFQNAIQEYTNRTDPSPKPSDGTGTGGSTKADELEDENPGRGGE